MTTLRYLVLVVAGQLLFSTAGYAVQSELETQQVTYQQVEVARSFEGVIESIYESTVSAQTSGVVEEIMFDVDDVVRQGEVILRLNDVEQRARVADAAANEKNAIVLEKDAQEEYARIANLAKKNLVSQAELDRAKNVLDAAQARLQQAQAQLSLANQQYAYTVIKAPYGGVLVARHVQVGELVQPGQPLLTGLSLSDLRVVTAVPDEVAQKLRNQATLSIQSRAHGEHVLSAAQTTVFPYADPRTHNFRVRVPLPESLTGFHPGDFVKVNIITGTEQRLLVPASSVSVRGEVKAVYVVGGGGSLTLRYIVTGKSYGEHIEVLSGLTSGEVIALNPSAAVLKRKSGE